MKASAWLALCAAACGSDSGNGDGDSGCGRHDEAGYPSILADSGEARGVAVDPDRAYWADATGTIYSDAVSGGDLTTVAEGLVDPSLLVEDGDDLLVVAGDLRRVPKSGGSSEVVVPALGNVTHLAASSAGYVWAEEDGSIWVLDRGSEDSRLLVDTLVEIPGLAADAEHAYWAGTESPGGVVMSSVNRTRLLDGTTEELTSGSFVVVAVAAGPAGVYWISGGILTMDETTSSPRVISERGGNFLSMAGGDLYAADLGSGEIRMHALADGTEATLARGQLLVTHLAADEGAVAWTYQRPECTVKALQLP